MSKSPFINLVRQNIRMRGYSMRTEKTYLYWICNYIRFHRMQHPKDLSPEHVVSFLSYLANRRDVAINTQKNSIECLKLRVKDIDLLRNSITVHDGKVGKDRQTILSSS